MQLKSHTTKSQNHDAYLAAGSGSGRDTTRSSEKDVLLIFVFVACKEFLLLSVKEADNVPTLQDILFIFAGNEIQRIRIRSNGA